jgi:RNA polymerase sigma-70 factor, ECF subfamily
MDEREWLAQRFQEHRPRLRAVAYRMLGSTSEADDALQEAWIRLSRSNAGEIDNLQAWLVTVVGRVALSMLRSRKRRGEEPLEAQHLPDPIVVDRAEEGIDDPEHEALLSDSVGLALLIVLETLTPPERLAYVLHDMFSVPFKEIAPIVERSPEAARQLASRARRRVRGAAPVPDADLSAQWEVVEAFVAAARDGDFEALLAVLDPEIVERVDTGSGTILEVRGAHNVARRAMAFSQRDGLEGRRALINGAPGWVSVLDGELYAIAALTVHNGRITTMDILLDPARLARLDLSADFFDS